VQPSAATQSRFSACMNAIGTMFTVFSLHDPDSSMAEGLTQDIFFHVWKKMASFKGQALFRTWLYRVTINRVLLHFRKHSVGTLPLDDQTLPVMETALLKNSAQTDLDNCLSLRDTVASLSPRYRRVLMLHDLDGFRHSDISRLLGITSGQAVHNSAKPGPRSVLL
jgi:RNA polymerase sigma-70 factor, ECF subfamily